MRFECIVVVIDLCVVLFTACHSGQPLGDVFLIQPTPSVRVCENLCLYTSQCLSFKWNTSTRKCQLNSKRFDNVLGLKSTGHVCEHRPCATHETCVPVEGATAYLCFVMSDINTAASSTTQTPATTTVIATSDTTTDTTVFVSTAITTDASGNFATDKPDAATTASTTSTATTTNTNTNAAAGTTTTTTTATAALRTTTSVTFTYIACYKDDRSRILPNTGITNQKMTTANCFTHCLAKEYRFFGTQNGNQCFCGNVIKSGYDILDDADCNKICGGDHTLMCGGVWRISVYEIF